MDDAVDGRVGGEDFVEIRLIGQVDLVEYRALATD